MPGVCPASPNALGFERLTFSPRHNDRARPEFNQSTLRLVALSCPARGIPGWKSLWARRCANTDFDCLTMVLSTGKVQGGLQISPGKDFAEGRGDIVNGAA